MSDTGPILRVAYQEGQILAAADLSDEQTYLIDFRRRLAVAQHDWGVVFGLQLTISADGLHAGAGVAVDGYGRQLIVSDEIVVPVSSLSGDAISVWLAYVEEPLQGSQARVRDRVSQAPGRVLETTQVLLTPEASPNPRQPDTSGGNWPVFLGLLRLQGQSYALDTTGRPLIGLVGETITSASGAAAVRLGSDFAVSLASDSGGGSIFTDILRTANDGNTHILGDATVHAVTIVQPASTPPSGNLGVGLSAPPATPRQAASPWQIYRGSTADTHGAPINQLCLEIAGAQGQEDPSSLKASVGGMPANGVFQSGLSISSDGTITISGDLNVTGDVIESPIPADPTDPRFLQAVLDAWVTAVSAATGGYLTVSIDELASGNLGISYTLTFLNMSGAVVSVTSVLEFVTLDGVWVAPPSPLISPFDLPPGGTEKSSRSLQLGKPGMLSLGLMVVGSAPGGIALRAESAQQIQVV